jgi:hypothetical protein
MRVFVLGVGAMGSLLTKLLLLQGHDVRCGDRDLSRARAFLGEHSTLLVQQVNARNSPGIVKAAKGCHLLVNACPAAFNRTILRAAVRLRSHYIDTASRLTQSPFRPEQYRFDRLFRENKRLALIHAGVAPGLTNLLAMQAAAELDSVERVQVRLFEETASDNPVSQWSADDSFDEAVSRPRIYRNGRFELGERFGERELFRFPAPIGQVGVWLAAQDEVVTIPHALRLREMDAKIGGIDMDRLRRWYRQGKLNRSRGLVAARFPATPTPRAMSKLVRRGILRNERFAASVLVYGRKQTHSLMIRWDGLFPSLFELCREGLTCSPVAWSAAHLTALFVKQMPRELAGVYTPEALPIATSRNILRAARSSGIRLTRKVMRLKRAGETPDNS